MTHDVSDQSVSVYLPWLRASITIVPGDMDKITRDWIDAANTWQRRALYAERQLSEAARDAPTAAPSAAHSNGERGGKVTSSAADTSRLP